MSTITTIAAGDLISNSRSDINTNFANLNTDKIETSVLDTDTALAANSDAKVATQKAVKAYVDAGGNVNASTTTKGIVEEATAAEVLAGTATGATGARLFINPSNQKSPDIQVFTADGTWTKPANASIVEVICIGSGGGGSRSVNGTSIAGGGGGGGGLSRRTFPASILGSTETITVGPGGVGATTNGSAGGDGPDSKFGAWLAARGGKGGTLDGSNRGIGGAGGIGEGTASTAPAVNTAGVAGVLGGASGASSHNAGTTGLTGGAASPFGAGGGGSGGNTGAGGAGGAQTFRGTTIAGGTGGAQGVIGNSPTDVSAGEPCPGAGGGGGGGNTTTSVCGAGAVGGKYGGGGGGGGANVSGTTANGGNGGVGVVIVRTYV